MQAARRAEAASGNVLHPLLLLTLLFSSVRLSYSFLEVPGPQLLAGPQSPKLPCSKPLHILDNLTLPPKIYQLNRPRCQLPSAPSIPIILAMTTRKILFKGDHAENLEVRWALRAAVTLFSE